jgi:hypothetical protein
VSGQEEDSGSYAWGRTASTAKRPRNTRKLAVRAGIVVVVVLVLIPVVLELFGADEQASEDQALITAALAKVLPGRTLREFNALFTGVSTLPQAAISLDAASADQRAELTAQGEGGSNLRFAFDTSAGFRNGLYYAVAIFPRTPDGPAPMFAVFDKESDTLVAKTEVECTRAMEIMRLGPIVPPEAYQDDAASDEIISDSAFAVWLSGRTRVATTQARLLRCIP